ncbi:MAG: dTDP-4-dehydrorhamnose reductase [Verrucomicrobiales bacterium]
MKTRVIIVGSRGRIGGSVVGRLSRNPGFEVTALDRAALPLNEPEPIRARLREMSFDVLVNCAAITGVDACEADPAAAWAVNTLAPAAMAEVCREKGARMIHLSTDYVFDGEVEGLRSEEEQPNPLGEYSKGKLEGEKLVLQGSPDNLVIRTSWVFGPRRPSFPDMILERARAGGGVSAICDKWSSPCYSEDFAIWLEKILARPDIHGTLHLCNEGACSWQEYGQATLDIFTRLTGEKLPVTTVQAMALSEMKHFTARRPIHSALSCERFARLTGEHPRPWKEALEAYLSEKFPTATRTP